MKRLDEGKISLVEFLRSIKYRRRAQETHQTAEETHFAGFSPQARADQKGNSEELSLIRSVN